MTKIKLNDGQLNIIKLLYSYRFGSIDQLRTSLNMKNNSGLYQKLEILINHGYIGKHYKNEYRLLGIPAAYYLRPKAYKALIQEGVYDIPDTVIQAGRRDNNRSESFISHMKDVYSVSLEIMRLYPNISFYSKREIIGYDAFPDNLPDAYLALENGSSTQHYFLDIIQKDTPRYVINKLIGNYHEFFLEDTWSKSAEQLPALLIIIENGKSEKYYQKLIRSRQDALDMTEPRIYTTTLTALKNITNDSDCIWSEVSSTDDLLSLPNAI